MKPGDPSPTLSPFERAVLECMLSDDAPELLPQIAGLKVASRALSGAGEYVNFARPSGGSTGEERPLPNIGSKVMAKVRGVDLGFVLFSNDGALSCLEIFLYSAGDYPTDFSAFEITRA